MRDCKTCVNYGYCTDDDMVSCAHGDNIGHSDYRPKTSEYIEREVAINRIRKVANTMGFENPAVAIDCTISVLENTPAADVAPVRHEKWEVIVGSDGKEHMVCTGCRKQQDLTGVFTYCPNCGAKMDLED